MVVPFLAAAICAVGLVEVTVFVAMSPLPIHARRGPCWLNASSSLAEKDTETRTGAKLPSVRPATLVVLAGGMTAWTESAPLA